MYERRFAIQGSIALAIGEFDSKLSYNRSELHYNPDVEEVREMDMGEQSEWSRLYCEHLYELVMEVMAICFDCDDYGVVSDEAVRVAHAQADDMVSDFEQAIGYT